MSILELTTVEDIELIPMAGSRLKDEDRYFILRLIQGFSFAAERLTGRKFRREQRIQYFTTNGRQQYIQLPAYGGATDTIDSVYEDTERVFGSTALLTSSDYFFDSRTGLLFRDTVPWELGAGHIKVTWTAGFGTTIAEVPFDLRMAANMQVFHWWQRKGEMGLMSKSFDGGTVEMYASPLLPVVEEILYYSYRIHSVV